MTITWVENDLVTIELDNGDTIDIENADGKLLISPHHPSKMLVQPNCLCRQKIVEVSVTDD